MTAFQGRFRNPDATTAANYRIRLGVCQTPLAVWKDRQP